MPRWLLASLLLGLVGCARLSLVQDQGDSGGSPCRDAACPACGDAACPAGGDATCPACGDAVGCGCTIAGAFVPSGAANPQQPCEVCDPQQSGTAWTLVACVSTFAGDGVAGTADGPLATARFDMPEGMALSGSGKLYVVDWSHRVRVIEGGQVSTLAGTGNKGYLDGPALAAKFSQPLGVAVDAAGKVYVADTGNHRIRVVAGGQVSTLAGDGVAGFADGPAATARFNKPSGVAVDSAGRVYVVELSSLRVRMIDNGQVSTLAGDGTKGHVDGPAAQAQFMGPHDVAVDSAGTVYVTDAHAVRVIKGGLVSTLAGSGSQVGFVDGPLSQARFTFLEGVALDASGAIYLGERGTSRVRRIVSGQVQTLAGSGVAGFADGPATTARFDEPTAAIPAGGGKVYISDTNNNRIRLLTL